MAKRQLCSSTSQRLQHPCEGDNKKAGRTQVCFVSVTICSRIIPSVFVRYCWYWAPEKYSRSYIFQKPSTSNRFFGEESGFVLPRTPLLKLYASFLLIVRIYWLLKVYGITKCTGLAVVVEIILKMLTRC